MPFQEEFYRLRADQCREQTDRLPNPDEQARWAALADEWLRMASGIERIRLILPPVNE